MGLQVGPLSPFDEYPIHQTSEPLRFMASSDGRAFDRCYFAASDLAQELLVELGFGVYPNAGTADAFAIFAHGGQHVSVRAHRLIGYDRADMRFGPISAEVVVPFQEWRLRLAENSEGLSFDLTYHDTKPQVFIRRFPVPASYDGITRPDEHSGYEGFGRVSGWVELQGRRFELTAEATRATRDHHWGIREGMGGRGFILTEMHRSTHCSQYVEFGDWGIWAGRVFYDQGTGRPPAVDVVKIERQLRFDPETKDLIGGTFINHLETGEVKRVDYEQVANCVAYLRTGMYIGPDRRGTPTGDVSHGQFVGDGVVVGETHDVSTTAGRLHLQGMGDRLCRASCDGETTFGVLETIDPIAYELCAAATPGFAFAEERV
ncbi:hypothetical protein [Dactylosporangium sp. CA-092794]|uniref:hypothetical protein n=1 Tax=Dactylosporangium sp. CA-092794 TaxID=3239929 RepID=UPI003D8BFF2D